MTTEKDNIEQPETTVEEPSVETPEQDNTELLEQAVQDAEAKAEVEEQPSYLTEEDVSRILAERKDAFDNAHSQTPVSYTHLTLPTKRIV